MLLRHFKKKKKKKKNTQKKGKIYKKKHLGIGVAFQAARCRAVGEGTEALTGEEAPPAPCGAHSLGFFFALLNQRERGEDEDFQLWGRKTGKSLDLGTCGSW